MRSQQQLWREADALFDRLLDLANAERAGALALAASGDDELQAAVARLLAAHDADSGVLGRIVPGIATDALRGRVLGRWRLNEEIGRGGMAVVYRAEAIDGHGQVAAVKLLTLAALAAGGAARFAQEQELLARLHHPHIATLFDAGVASDGTPWLAMALVDGVRIDQWCAQRGLSARAIVQLFLDVCDAVAYAHRNLVIHRDLKPSNVLVDADGHVRLLDFGIARLVDAQVEATASQWRALTPEYAAPEQFAGALPSTAMDVYGLGALLYRLLVGRAPRSAQANARAEVTAPSRIANDPAIAQVLKGDLDAVLLKALSADPQQRHDGALSLRQDLQAWLEQRPVSARPAAWHYRLARLIARNLLATVAAAALLIAIVLGVATTLYQAQRAQQAAALAQAETTRAREQAERATAIKDLVLSLFASADPERAGGAALDSRQMLQRGAQRIGARGDLAPDLRLEILTTIAQAQSTLAWYDDAAVTRVAAHALVEANPGLPVLLRAQLLREEANVHHHREEHDAALAAYARAEAVLAGEHTAAAERLRIMIDTARGNTLARLNRFDEALSAFAAAQSRLSAMADADTALQESLLAGWGNAAYSAGDYTTAIEKLDASYALQQRAGNEGNASIVRTLNLLSAASAMAGQLGAAVRYDAESLAIARRSYPDDHPQIATAAYAYGDTLRQAGRYAEAMAALDEARAIRARINSPPGEAVMVEFTRVRVLVAQGRFAEAVALVDAIRPVVAETKGAASPAIWQLATNEIAALMQDDPQRLLAARIRSAEALLGGLDADMAAHPVARLLRWRVARAQFALGDGAASARSVALASALPEGSEDHPTNALANQGLRLRLRLGTNAAKDSMNEMQALRAAIESAQGASTEVLAYAWLSIVEAARVVQDPASERAAIDALTALDRERPLPAEYASALRAIR